MLSRCGPTPLSSIFISIFRVRFGAESDVRFTPESGHVPMVMSALLPKADMCSAM